jgi:TonB family protein
MKIISRWCWLPARLRRNDNEMKKNKVTGLVGTIVLHVVLLLLLLLVAISKPKAQEEGGVPVMLGNMEMAQGNADPYTLTDVDILDEPQLPSEVSAPEPVPTPPVKTEMITQEDEPTVTVPKKETPKPKVKTETVKKETPKKEPVKPKEKTEAEKWAEAERLAAEKKAAEERAAAEAAAKRIAGAFGKGTQMGSKGTADSGEGLQGSPTGNAAEGKSTGIGGYGTFDLNGRSLGPGGLPMPVYNVQEEGRVVVTITVNPAGQVIHTSINKRTNTANAALRKAAEDAAKKARFNTVGGVNNQTGTITYYFKLK